MISLPFVENSAPDGVRRPVVEIVGGSGNGGLGESAAARLLGGGGDFWTEHYVAIALDLGPAPFVDSLRISYTNGAVGTDVALGDSLSLSLGYADSETLAVFSGQVTIARHSLTGQNYLHSSSGSFALSHLRLNQSYEQQNAGDIVIDLAKQVGVKADVIESGIALPFYRLAGQTSAYYHIAQLARRSGYWAYCNPKGELIFAPVKPGQSVQTFTYGVDILSLEVEAIAPNIETVIVTGEGAAGSQGQAAGNWLVADPSGVQAQAGGGSGGLGLGSVSKTRYISDGALRSQEAVKSAATSRIAAASTPLAGELWVPGAPAVTVGSTLTLADIPEDFLNGDFIVKRVCHRMSKAQGFTTRLSILQLGEASLLPGLASLGGLL